MATAKKIALKNGFGLQVLRLGRRVARGFVFKPKIPNLGKFWGTFECQMLVYSMTIWNILWPFGIIYGRLV
jgi:hypothetical protein